jgi:6-phosphogluconolactonase (cycloisomerase 2 family)
MTQFPGPLSVLNMLAAEILVPTPSATFSHPYMYVSNRNDPASEGDVIAVFSVADPTRMEPAAEIRSGLSHLRGMVFGGGDDRFLIAGGANGGGVKVFERTDGGKDLREVASLNLEAPTAFLWAK